MNREKVVVTGGAGFIGSHVVDWQVDKGREVHVVDDLSSGKIDRVNEAATLHRIDVSKTIELCELADEIGNIKQWFHLGAQIDVRMSVKYPIMDAMVNVLGTISVLEAARRSNAQVVFTSTGGAIYGEAIPPTPESAVERPDSQYGVSKLSAESYIAQTARLYGYPHVILRLANIYGPRQDPHGEAGVVAIFGGSALRGDDVTIYGDGTQTRDYVFVHDLVEIIDEAATMAQNGLDIHLREDGAVPIYNVGTGVETTVLDLWSTVQAAAGVELGYSLAPSRPGEVMRSALDSSLLTTTLGHGPRTTLLEGLTQTINWQRGEIAV